MTFKNAADSRAVAAAIAIALATSSPAVTAQSGPVILESVVGFFLASSVMRSPIPRPQVMVSGSRSISIATRRARSSRALTCSCSWMFPTLSRAR